MRTASARLVRRTLRLILGAIDYTARHVYTRGRLARVHTIHFARWVFIDNGQRTELGDRQRADVADAAPLEVARGRVVDGVVVLPALEGGEQRQAERRPEKLVCTLGAEERPV